MKLLVEITPMQWGAMYLFCQGYELATVNSHINQLVLAEWVNGIRPNTLWKWQKRNGSKTYKEYLPYTVTVAFWQEAQANQITAATQSALGVIDQALKNEGFKP
ncbi:hypothetical protein [Runella zeae]|uniref:hypothetical protein n=1 Tax=Runella zeae TaxID=94255 RepID=UPI00041ABEC4|nr:hypothetical protein [Runella zeae]